MNFFYDANGNQIRKEKGGLEKWYYTYDFENRLTKVEYFDGTQTSTLGEYYYDGDGKRIKKVEASQTTIYIYLGWNVIYEKEFSTMTETKYIFKADCGCHVGKMVGGTTYFLHVDHLGSVRQETDGSGNTVWASPAVYEPFGELRGGGPANNEEGHLYTGKPRDVSTGLYYYGARYYDAKIGRFITKDLWAGNIQVPSTLNDYIYVLNNPLKLIDQIGNSPSCPLCKPGEGYTGPPLPVSHYLWGLVIAAAITAGIWLSIGGGAALLWNAAKIIGSMIMTKISTSWGQIRAWSVSVIDSLGTKWTLFKFQVTSWSNKAVSNLENYILKVKAMEAKY